MAAPQLPERMAELGLRLPAAEMPAFAVIVADTDRIAAWVRSEMLHYADEPATCFAAPRR